MHAMHRAQGQRGFIAVMFVFALFMTFMGVLSAGHLWVMQAHNDRRASLMADDVKTIQDALVAWYGAASTNPSIYTSPPNEAALISALGLGEFFATRGLRIGLTVVNRGSLYWHDAYVWRIPEHENEGGRYWNESARFFDEVNATKDGIEFRRISLADEQARRYDQMLNQFQKIRRAFQHRWNARAEADPERIGEINYYLENNCNGRAGDIESDALKCSNGAFITAGEMGVIESVGLAAADLINPWGGPIEFKNSGNHDFTGLPLDSPALPPMSALMRTRAPWGKYIYFDIPQP